MNESLLSLSASLFRHCPRCAATAEPETQGNRFDCPACGFVYHFNPATAATVFVVDGEERLLLIRRQHEPAKGSLGLPGGFIDAGERAEAAARREVLEETGVVLEGLHFLATHSNLYPYKGILYPVLDLFFFARVASFQTATPRDEVDEIILTPIDEVNPADLAFASMRAAWADFQAYRTA
ncbi:NUDIX domain-containing protein [Verrucomicrobium sp. GAS474]|uniref:NUDIX hydrolase n=1 Tax=Verrucomicrobium sp. GAS474 TaxID=1882831 RepID=UPI00087DC4EE|nr:NUDIX domain-containing protein [Verrucomicrobium sp. GAS474]SDU09799.1 NUDIX domain-containing protein [Verrucomicrobium sp. GAS474]